MKLYGYWRSLATYRVRVALNLKRLSAEEIPVDLQAGAQHAPDYRAINAQPVVPVLVDRTPLFQSLAILEYLDEQHPDPPLLPRDARGRARVRALAGIVACDSHPLIVPRIRNYLADEFGLSEAQRLAWIRHWIREGLAALEGHLARDPATGLYCHGDVVSIADICLVSLTIGQELFKGDLADFPKVARIAAHCSADDAFAQAHPLRQPGAPARI